MIAPHLPLRRTQGILLFERAYAALVPPLALIAGFVGLTLLGAWGAVPWPVHTAAIVLTAVGLAVLILRGRRDFRWPNLDDAAARLEGDSGLPPGLLRDLHDTPFTGEADNPLWEAHLQRLKAKAVGAAPQKPRSLIDHADPLALRLPAVILLALGLFIGFDEAGERLARGLSPQWQVQPDLLADVWIEPPLYTRAPAQFLLRDGALEDQTASAATVPQGSVLHVRLSRRDGEPVDARFSLATAAGSEGLTPEAVGDAQSLQAPLQQNAALSVSAYGTQSIFPIAVTPDRVPSIRWSAPPETEGGRRLVLPLTVEDDYGVQSATLHMRLTPGALADLPPDAVRPSPDILETEETLPLDGLVGANGDRAVAADLSEHPWAGLEVEIAITIEDGAGQSARTAPRTVTIPARTFYNPLARTVIEARTQLALAPRGWGRTAQLFEALTFAPGQFATSSGEYLLLRTAYHDVRAAGEEGTDAVVESFWPLALSLEDEGLVAARQRLEAAQEALREALARGASPEEVEALVEELRDAMNEYLAALAASGDAMAESGGGQDGPSMTDRDLDDILDEIAELRRQGDTPEAQARLAELERLLQNLQLTQGSPGEGQSSGQGQSAGSGEGGQGQGEAEGPGGELDQAGDIIDQQRRLSDETFAAGREGSGGPDPSLSNRQRALAEAARALAQEAEGRPGTAPDGGSLPSGEDAFGEASRLMDRAAEALSRGRTGEAQGYQERALQSLRTGAAAEAERQLAERGEDGTEGGQSQQAGDGRMGGGAERDPLGRAYTPGPGPGLTLPDFADPERIQDLTRQIRERLANPDLSDEERQYLEGLLRRF